MTAALKDIVINIINGVITATGVNFGVPLYQGFVGSRSIVKWGSGITGIVARSVDRNTYFQLRVISGGAIAYAIGSENDVTITVEPTTRVRDLLAHFTANAPAPIQALISLEATGTGSGYVPVLANTESVYLTYLLVTDLDQLSYYYDSTDLDYKIVRNILASQPNPGTVAFLNTYGYSGDSLNNLLGLYDNGDWFLALAGTLTESLQLTIADYINGVDRFALFVSNDPARLSTVKGDHVAFIIHDDPESHPEASWAAKNLPSVPTVSWKWTPNLQAQTANQTADKSALQNVRDLKGNSYVGANGQSYVDGSQVNTISGTSFIDQIISRLWIKLNLEIDLFNLFLQAAARGDKVPYTDAGINQIVGVIENRLEIAGRLGIIAPTETKEQVSASSGGTFRYKVVAETRTQIEKSRPNDISTRVLRGIRYSYIEAGAIDKVEITGVILLTEG